MLEQFPTPHSTVRAAIPSTHLFRMSALNHPLKRENRRTEEVITIASIAIRVRRVQMLLKCLCTAEK
jgi:hypothetical protein